MRSKTIRLPVDLIDAAKAEGRAEHRSAAKQLEHWARFGMFFERQTSLSHRRFQRVSVSEASFHDVGDDERMLATSNLNATISAAANESSFADRLAAQGITTIVMDDAGRLVRRHPDGSTTDL
jgi:tetraacyldisaccharide-1-P 4'-kinase